MYGSAKVSGELVFGKAVHLARVPASELLTPSAWEYWDGEGWSHTAADSRPIVAAEPAGWSTSFTVARTDDGRFQMLTKENEFLGADVITGFSDAATGPFTRRLVARYPTLNTTPKQVFYTALSHPHLKVSGGILGHICRNTFSSSLAEVARDADRYKPQFFTVPTSRLTPIRGNRRMRSWPSTFAVLLSEDAGGEHLTYLEPMGRVWRFFATWGIDVLAVAAAAATAVGTLLRDDADRPDGLALWLEVVVITGVLLALWPEGDSPSSLRRSSGSAALD